MRTYYKLDEWDARSFCFRDRKRGYATEAEARVDAKRPGRYRISAVTDGVRVDQEPFDIAGDVDTATKQRRKPGRLCGKPTVGR